MVSSAKFEISQTLAIKLTFREINKFESINRKFFVNQIIEIPQGGCVGDWEE